MNCRTIPAMVFLVVGLVSATSGLQAQTQWLMNDGGTSVSLQWSKGFWVSPYEDGSISYDVASSSSNIVLAGRYVVQPGFVLVGEIPIIMYSADIAWDTYFDTGSGDFSSTQFANPYVGIEAGDAEHTIWVETGLRIPVIDYNQAFYDLENLDEQGDYFAAMFAQQIDPGRVGAYIDRYITWTAAVNWIPGFVPKPFSAQLRFGVLNIYHHVQGYDGAYATVIGNLFLRYSHKYFRLQLGYGGWHNSIPGWPPKRALKDFLGLSVLVPVGQVDILAGYRAPLREEMKNAIDGVLELGVTYRIGRK